MPSAEKLTILFLAANPDGLDQVKLDEEQRSIDDVLRKAEFRDRFELRPHGAVRYSDLADLLLRYQPHILHFSGHGNPSGQIVLKDQAGGGHPVAVEVLAALLTRLKDNLRCVVLNACYTQAQAELIGGSVDFVVGMSRAIRDDAAIQFATGFYRGLGYGRSIKTAFDLGCIEIGLAVDSGIVHRAMRPPTAPAPQGSPSSMEIPQLVALRSDPEGVTMLDDTAALLIGAQPGATRYAGIEERLVADLFVLLHAANLGDAEWAAFYQASLPSQVTPIPTADRWQMLVDLCTRPVQKPQNRMPVLDFVERAVAATRQLQARQGLRAWSNNIAHRFGITPTTTVASSARQLAYVMVVIRPQLGNVNDAKQQLYHLEIILWREEQNKPAVWQADDKALPLEEIRNTLYDKLKRVEQAAQLTDGVKRVVEFIVPVALLSAELERWERQDSWRRGTFGQVFPVAVRPLERVFSSTYMDPGTADEVAGQWRARWESFRAAQTSDFSRLCWLPANDYDTVFDTLLIDTSAVCVGFEHGVRDEEALVALVAAGVPVALWLRGDDSQHAGCDLKGSATAETVRLLAELREWTHEARVAAKQQQGSQPALGSHLALLWDDPQRIPEQPAMPGLQSG